MGNDELITGKDKKNIKNITPTVLVGLGGTGWEVLTRIKERLGYYIGGLPYYACLNFLHIDTDKPRQGGWQDDSQTKHIHACHGAEGLFDEIDTYGIGTWLPARGTETVRSFETGAGQVRPYGRLAFFANYINGGIKGAIKDAFDHIKDKQAREKLKESPKYKQLEEKTQIRMDTAGNNDVIIVASIAGGTGSGMFFDAVTALRQQMNGKGMIYAYLLFPDHYRDVGNIESMRANGYAFLKELEYFQQTNKNHRLEAKWPGDRSTDVFIQATLCDRVYLYSHTDELGRVTSKEEVFDSIAESIFKDFTFGGFADEKRSSENNENTDLNTMYSQNEVRDKWGIHLRRSGSRHFQALGYASLGMPHDQLVEACAYRLAAQVAQSWHPSFAQGVADSRTVDEVLQETGLRLSFGSLSGSNQANKEADGKNTLDWCLKMKKRQFSGRADEVDVNQLLVSLLGKRDSSQQSEMNWLDEEHTRLVLGVAASVSNVMAAQIENAVKECEEGLQARWDMHYQSVSSQLLPELKARLSAWCRQRVMGKGGATGDGEGKAARLSFIDLVKVVDELKVRLDKAASWLEGPLAKNLQTNYEAQKKRYAHFLAKLRSCPDDGKLGLFNRLEKMMGIVDFASHRELLAKNAGVCGFGTDGDVGYLEYALYKQVALGAADIVKQLAGFTDNLRQDYSLDAERLSNAVRYLNDRCALAARVRSSQHVKSLYDSSNAKDFDDIYAASLRRYHAKQPRYVTDTSASAEANEQRFCKSDIMNISSRFVEEIGDMGKIRLALQKGFSDAQTITAENTEWVNTLLSLTMVPFRAELPNVCCFWSRFAEAYPTTAQKEEAVIELFEASAFWCNRNHSFVLDTLQHGGTEQATYVLAGLPAVPEFLEPQEKQRMSELATFVRGKIESLADGLKLTVKDLPTSDELIVYRRSIALPLCYSEELVNMQEAYNEVRSSGKPLHITKHNRVFADISLLTMEMASATTRAIRMAALGLVFNVIKVTPRPLNPGDMVRTFDYTYLKPSLGADVNYLGQCGGNDGVREVAEQLEVRNHSDFISSINAQIDRQYQAIFQAEDNGASLKHWVVLCQLLIADLPKERNINNTESAQSGREAEHAVYLFLQKQAVEALRQLPGWKEEADCTQGEQHSEMQLTALAAERGDALFPKRREDGIRLWNTDWRQA